MPEKEQFIVADYENRWMSIFEAKGKFVSRFGMGKLLGKTPINFENISLDTFVCLYRYFNWDSQRDE
jgi:hypothetical protein